MKKSIGKSDNSRYGISKHRVLTPRQTKFKSSENGYLNRVHMSSFETPNILMVDDHPENLLALEAVLSGCNYNLVSASSGEEALKLLLKNEFAVILLDVQMPGMNGFETAEFIKAREKSKDIPIIFITAISQAAEHVLHGYKVGAIDYIFKPFLPETLKLKIAGFVKLFQNNKHIQYQNELLKKRTTELEEANLKLKVTTAALRKTDALARLICDTSNDTIVMLTKPGDILALNPATTVMFLYNREELIGQNISLLLPDVQALQTEDCKFTESTAKRKDGSTFPVDIQIGRAILDGGHLFICSIRDISLRKQMEKEKEQQYDRLEKLVQDRTQELLLANIRLQSESNERQRIAEELRESKYEVERVLDRFKKVFESSPCLIEIRSLRDYRYMDVNENWLTNTGYRYDEVKNKTEDILRLTFEKDENPANLAYSSHFNNLRNAKICYFTKNGDKHEGLLSTKTIKIQEETCLLCVITDITDMQNLERKIARLDRMYLIGEMAAGIAHEIRNPMTTVRGFLQLLKNNPSPVYIDLMVEELDRANTIITEYLTLARNRAADQKANDLNTIIHTLFPLIQAEAMMTNKSVKLELADCPQLQLDEKEIRQLILNLALNGLEAMNAGGKLTIRTTSAKKEVVLEIQDEGYGIKPDVLEKIGTPFFTTKDRGTGLGLAVCYSVAARHNASIHIKTGPPETVFSVHFRAEPKAPEQQMIPAHLEDGLPKKVH